MQKVGIIGFPGLYGGAGTELDNQITLWHEMGLEIHIVPSMLTEHEPLLSKVSFKAIIHNKDEYSALESMPVISFCNDSFLRDIEIIKKYASKTIFVNCMTWLFDKEKEAHKNGLIDLFLYQNEDTQKKVGSDLKSINPEYNWKIFHSWFDDSDFPFYKNRINDKFRFGRISREDADKYARDTLWIYESMVAPVMKSGILLGFDHRSETKIGKPPYWIRTYPGCGISQQEFYAHCSCIIQKEDATENFPRIAMESMKSGSVLIVDDRGGWKNFVKHGETGWLCRDSREFVYYGSRMAYEIDERERMAQRAYELLQEINNKQKSINSWKEIFEC